MGWRPGQTRVKVSAYGRSQLCRVPALTAAVAATGDMRAKTPLTRQREVPWEHEEHLSSSPDCQVYYITAAEAAARENHQDQNTTRRSRDFAALH